MSKNEPIYTEVEISDFELRYDGMYHITWVKNNKTYQWYIYLGISELIKMIKIEGFNLGDIIKAEYNVIPLVFKKVKLKCNTENEFFEAHGFIDELYGNTLREDGYTVELLKGDSLKKHKNEILLGSIEIKNESYQKEWDLAINK